MSRPTKLDHEFDQTKFRDLLRRAIGPCTIRDFADRSGVSLSTISMQLNAFRSIPPNPQTIFKIAQAEDRITYEELLDAAGYNPDKYVHSYITTLNVSEIDKYKITSDLITLQMCINSMLIAQGKNRITYTQIPSILNNDYSIYIEHYPIQNWYFLYSFPDAFHTIEKSKSEIKDTFLKYCLSIAPNKTSKLTFVTDSPEIFEFISTIEINVESYFSIVMIDFQKKAFIKELDLGKTIQDASFDIPRLRLVYSTK